jgi:hypothetical protein
LKRRVCDVNAAVWTIFVIAILIVGAIAIGIARR